ncbi:hypothetical protein C2857_007650 [Epichloe festucae Fl1]|uniref:Uncharacterized protein n=1 Tax=Epichloe festucae (strain Fl1) TaxID=877507 RepID=A0A7S9PUT9_EPIFF|nr:hypothetical protein C2857_007650 [Epichloe festucae Fl1]
MQDIYKHSARRLSSASSISSACSWASHEEEASSPTTSRRSSLRFFTYSRRDRNPSTPSTSGRTCEGMTTEDTRELWRCMLELQQLYGCYNSTRMDLAVNAGEAGIDLMPSEGCIPSGTNIIVRTQAKLSCPSPQLLLGLCLWSQAWFAEASCSFPAT